ncbi:5-oxoprolinase subunit PxpA [Chitinibacteraceae bacterium HSL-7]
MAHRIDLNADLGEGFAFDANLMPLITSVNVACGGHAGDVDTMRRVVRLARDHNVLIGAHPSYPDRAHFGRVSLQLSPMLLVEALTSQLWALNAVCIEEGASMAYIKPHGALYNDVARDAQLAELFVCTVREIASDLAIMGLAGSHVVRAAEAAGMQAINEAFVDRRYLADGSLQPRGQPGAVIEKVDAAIEQATRLARGEAVISSEGASLSIQAQSLCLHGDSAHALEFAHALRQHFDQEGIAIMAWELQSD